MTMMTKPREIRQARAFLFNRGLVVSNRYCKVFVGTAKAMRLTFGELDRQMREEIMTPAFIIEMPSPMVEFELA